MLATGVDPQVQSYMVKLHPLADTLGNNKRRFIKVHGD